MVFCGGFLQRKKLFIFHISLSELKPLCLHVKTSSPIFDRNMLTLAVFWFKNLWGFFYRWDVYFPIDGVNGVKCV